MTRREINKKLENLKELASKAADEWRELFDDMQCHFDDKSEKWQEGERGEEYQAWLQTIAEAIDRLDEVADTSLD